MVHYKFLVMQDNDRNNVGFLTSSLGGGLRFAKADTNVTHFRPHDFGGGHDNDYYWNTAGKLLVGFARWYLRIEEKEAYQMGNRFYAATNTYRFFRIDEDLDRGNYRGYQLDLANRDLASFEITEEEFIEDMVNSWEFNNIRDLFPPMHYDIDRRVPSKPVEVTIVYNKEFRTWCWISDYLPDDKALLETLKLEVPVGLHYDDALEYINKEMNCNYRFGGNDSYNKKRGK